jgi:hypothetical protein
VSEDSIKFLKRELTTCFEQHDLCRTPLGSPPTRLLRIERLQEGVEHVYLEDSDMSKSYAYATLSHCWGGMQPLCLTKETEGILRAGMHTRVLPKTFRDAVSVCLCLELQYIWIDCLSIFQDNLQDWATEAAIMHAVYKNALLNIAANGAADASIGLSFERSPLAFRPFCVSIGSAMWVFPPDWSALSIQKGPLIGRAWVLQERILSTRVIHFTVAGARWECMQHLSSEVYPSESVNHVGQYTDYSQMFQEAFTQSAMSRRAPLDVKNKSEHKVCYSRWLGLLSEYSRCGITKSEDKLPAIQGVAQAIKDTFGVELVCGMWKDLLILELLWEIDTYNYQSDPPHLLQWRAPSWSWANSDFRLELDTYPSRHLECPGFEEVARITHLNVTALPSGQVSDASLTLKGKSVRAKIAVEDFNYKSLSLAAISCKDQTVQIDARVFVFDRRPLLPHADELTFLALARCHCTVTNRNDSSPDKSTEAKPTIAALMLRRLPTTPPTYSRVGVLIMKTKDAYDFYMQNQSAEEEELALV